MKKTAKKQEIVIISLGGSIVYPHRAQEDGHSLNVTFLTEFRRFIMAQAKKGRRFIIVVGGGKVCRRYQKAVRAIMDGKHKNADLDWLGIQLTKVNALFIAKILREISFPQILDHEPGKKEVSAFLNSGKKVLAVSGWLPGWSTDYDAVQCAKIFNVSEIISASDEPYVCDKDPRKNPDAKAIMDIAWKDYLKLIPSKWTPGLSTPVDPLAARLAKKIGLTIKKIKGTDIESYRKAVEGEAFDGTIIHE